MRQAVAGLLEPSGRRVLCDCTVGLGGHAESLLDAAGREARLIGIDLDEGNLNIARRRLERFDDRVRLFKADFADLPEVLRLADTEAVDLLLADLGISSNQLDDPTRGLSFSADGPLDMRMDAESNSPAAAELVNTLGEKELADLIYAWGEERYSRRIARAIVNARRERPIRRTARLAEIVTGAYPPAARRSRRGVHPATRTFQALRIAVNGELDSLDRLLSHLPGVLNVGGRAGVISFHSLEDRRVKQRFAGLQRDGSVRRLNRKPLTPDDEEKRRNPRSRSAKLRGIERIQ